MDEGETGDLVGMGGEGVGREKKVVDTCIVQYAFLNFEKKLYFYFS